MRSFLILSLLVILTILSAGFTREEDTIKAEIKTASLQALNDCRKNIQELKNAAAEGNQQAMISAFHKARSTYKTQEFILEYFHHSVISGFINGAPLPKMEKKVADLRVIEPQGFQRIEELIYEEEPDFDEIKRISTLFIEHIEPIISYHDRISIEDRHLLEASRYELIRIYTLGVTAFETPASDSAIAEAQIAFDALKKTVHHYARKAGDDYQMRCETSFKRGYEFFNEKSVEQFDYLNFLRDVIDPLFRVTLDIHQKLGVETFREVNSGAIPTNYEATSIFDINLLNKDYFYQSPVSAISPERIELGRLLFFDPALSYNNSLSCASCHHPEKAFTDGLPKSQANDKHSTVDRNAPTLVNALLSHSYFHDLRADRLQAQVEHVMANEKEFSIRPNELTEKLKKSEEYQSLFAAAFPGNRGEIRSENITNALAAYVQSLTSWNSSFDRYARKESEELSASAKRGYNLFMGKAACATCHFAPSFAGLVPPFYDDTESEVLGITTTADSLNLQLDKDPGRVASGKQLDRPEFYRHSIKTPTVRNVEVTGPYFHNGAFETLDEVMWFYNNGGGQGLGLDVPNQTLPPDHLGLSQQEIRDIVAFMNSLTDYQQFVSYPDQLPDFEGIPELQDRVVVSY